MNSKQRRVAKRRIDVYGGGFEKARTSCEAAARALMAFGLSIQQVNSALILGQRASPFTVKKLIRITTP